MGVGMGSGAGLPEYEPSDWDEALAGEIVARHADRPGALLPILRELQDVFGYIDRAALPIVADGLNISKAEVFGVASFYHDFKPVPGGAHTLKICRAEACQSMGAEALIAEMAARHGLKIGETTTDRRLTLEAVYCLGNCALSPAGMLDGELIGRLDTARLDAIVKDRAG